MKIFELLEDRSDVTQTPEFKRWFGNSKVVDGQGKPLVVYHGSTGLGQKDVGISVFRSSDFGKVGPGIYFTDVPDVAAYHAGGRQFKDSKEPAVYPVYLSIKNPVTNQNIGQHAEPLIAAAENLPDGWARRNLVRGLNEFFYGIIGGEKARAEGRVRGYLNLQRLFDLERQGGGENTIRDYLRANFDGVIWKSNSGDTEYVAYRPEQIKSAIGNNGKFDPNNPDITKEELI